MPPPSAAAAAPRVELRFRPRRCAGDQPAHSNLRPRRLESPRRVRLPLPVPRTRPPAARPQWLHVAAVGPPSVSPRTDQMSTVVDDTGVRRLVVQACRVLNANGHNDYIWGHVAIRDEAGRGVWMKPSGVGFEEVRENHVILIDADGVVIEGDQPRHSEWPIHTEIMAARHEICGTVHTHPPHAIALVASGQPLLPLSHAGTLFTPPEMPRFDLTANLVSSKVLGTALADTLGRQNAAFMVNHGIVTAGTSLQEAVVRAVLLEKACHQQLLALQAGTPLTWPDPEAALDKRSTVWSPAHLKALWDYLVRSLDTD